MRTDWHLTITGNALEGSGLQNSSKRLIKNACAWDSDFDPRWGWACQQHYQNTGNSRDSISRATIFWQRVIASAADFVAEGATAGNFNKALYFFGRACHCVQDFYSHSNWVMLGKTEVWDFDCTPNNLRVCYPSPEGTAVVCNMKGFRPPNPDKMTSSSSFLKKGNYYTEEESYDRMLNEDLFHPELQLDYPGSWADKVFKANFHKHYQSRPGFKIASQLAEDRTVLLWGTFLDCIREVDPQAVNALKEHTCWTLTDRRPLANEFCRVMGNPLEEKKAALKKLKQWASNLSIEESTKILKQLSDIRTRV